MRNVCFTLNNPEISSTRHIHNYFNMPHDSIKYLVYQTERGECGTLHIQGYAELNTQKSLRSVKTILDEKIHAAPRRGTPQQAADYCKKEEGRVDGPFEWGTISRQGTRTDMEDIRDRIIEGGSIIDIALQMPGQFVRYNRGIQALQQLLQPPVRGYTKKRVIVLYGPPGTGKTSFVHGMMTHLQTMLYEKDPDTQWWDNYQNQSNILLDEFPGTCTAKRAKKLLGESNGPLQTKGGQFTTDKMETLWLTSNDPPPCLVSSCKSCGSCCRPSAFNVDPHDREVGRSSGHL